MILFKRNKCRFIWVGLSFLYPIALYACGENLFAKPLFLLYPVIINLLVACLFLLSLFYPPTIVEKIARRTEPDLDEAGVLYTRKVTKAWILFLIVNALISFSTAFFGNMKIWTLYNSCISYVLMGIFYLGEYIIRQYVRRKRS